jgi:hypothetical protein
LDEAVSDVIALKVVGNVDILRTSVKLRVLNECYSKSIIRIKYDRPFNRQMHLIYEYAEMNDMPNSIALAPVFRIR